MDTYPNTSQSRRDFLKKSSLAAAALAFPFSALPESLKGVPMGVVVHSYSRYGSKVESQIYPGFKDAIDLMRHCHSIGAGGIQTTVGGWAEDFGKKVRDEREKLGMYLEGSIGLPKNAKDVGRFETELLAAKEAGAMIEAVVIMATVVEPWAVLSPKAIRKGRKIPQFASLMEEVTKSPTPEFCSIFPNTAPAPVIKITGAATNMASPIQPEEDRSFRSNFFGKVKDRIAPIKREMTGVPKNKMIEINFPSPNGLVG